MRLLVSGTTRTVRGLTSRWPRHLGHLLTPANGNRVATILATGLPWAADNGAFSGFDPDAFRLFLARVRGQPRLLWVACPDVVADARGTLARFGEWLPEMRACGQPVAFVGQDGAEDLPIPWEDFHCWFVGGSTKWKLSQASAGLVAEAKARGKLVHMGRVNSLRRITAAYDMRCDSVDGSSASMFGDRYVHGFCAWISHLQQQGVLF